VASPSSGSGVSGAQGSLIVSADVVGVIPPNFLGLSYEKLAISYPFFRASNHNLISLFKLLGAGVLRLGGGSVDHTMFTSETNGTHSQITSSNIKNLAAFIKATGWMCIYGINLATSTPTLAAEEAAVAAATLGADLLGFEIGNEPDGYGVPGGFFQGEWSFMDFLARWNAFRSAVQQSAPQVPIVGPATSDIADISSWTVPFGQATSSSNVTLLTQHYYRSLRQTTLNRASTFLVSPDTKLTSALERLQGDAKLLGLPYRIDECNSFPGGGLAGVSNSYASALWVIDFLFDAALGGAAGVNLHGGGQGPGYTPIADRSGEIIEARPEYYGLLLFAMAGTGALLSTELFAGALDVTAYAVHDHGSNLQIVVVNKEPVQTLALTIQADTIATAATMITMSGTSLAATTGVTIQGASVDPDGSFMPASRLDLSVTRGKPVCSIPPLTAALISIS
jgi:hypothetical protein